MEIDDRWADMVDPTLETAATEAKQPALAVVTGTPAVNPDYTADVIALGAEDSILKLGVNVTVVDFSFDPLLNGVEAVICGHPDATKADASRWLCSIS